MKNTEKLYHDLSGIDLDEQRRIWDERGKGYYGEYCVFKDLLINVNGCNKLLVNLNIPTSGGRTTEIDLLMIHETGIYIFEVKHYKGTIYGDSDGQIWTQYFRTTANNTFKNPILQNEYHLSAIKRLYPDAPIFSVIVFTNDECSVKVNNNNPAVVITTLDDMGYWLNDCFLSNKPIYNIEDIDRIFNQLVKYSPIKESTLTDDYTVELSFYDYVQRLKIDVGVAQSSFVAKEENIQKEEKKLKREKVRFAVLFAALTVLLSGSYVHYYQEKSDLAVAEAERELESMKRNFQHVDFQNDGDFELKDNFIEISEVVLKKDPDILNVARFSCKLTNNAENYGIMFKKTSKYIVMLADGTVQEYDMYGERLAYSGRRVAGTSHSGYYSKITLEPLDIYNIPDLDDIEYIKIVDLILYTYNESHKMIEYDGYEIEVYSK